MSQIVAVVLLGLTLAGCGSEEGGGLGQALQGLGSFPSIQTVVDTTSPAVRFRRARSISGYAPLIASDLTNFFAIEPPFFNGVVTAINGGAVTPNNAFLLWGDTMDNTAGLGACLLTQSVSEPLGDFTSANQATCYIKGLSSTSDGVTRLDVNSNDVPADVLYAQADVDRLISVSADFGFGMSTAMVTVFGTDTVGTHLYQVTIGVCQAGTAITRETWQVDRISGDFSMTSQGTLGTVTYTHNLSATLRALGTTLGFNSFLPRTGNTLTSDSGSGTVTQGWFQANGSSISAKRASTSATFVDTNYGVVGFSGNTLPTLAVTNGAYIGVSTDAGANSHHYQGEFEFHDIYYDIIPPTSLSSSVSTFDFTTDSFFTSLGTPAPDLSDINCAATPDVTVTVDPTNSSVISLAADCTATVFDGSQLCYQPQIQTAKNAVWGLVPP